MMLNQSYHIREREGRAPSRPQHDSNADRTEAVPPNLQPQPLNRLTHHAIG